MTLFVVAVLAAIGVPGTSGAPGELLILAAAFARSPGIGLLVVLVSVVSAVYGAGMLRAVFFGPTVAGGTDLGWRGRSLGIGLLVLVVVIGVVPGVIGQLVERSLPAVTEMFR